MIKPGDRRGVIVGLVSSAIFLAFIQPLMSAMWRLLADATPRLLETYADRFYQQAALSSNWTSVATLQFVTSAGIGIFFATTSRAYIRIRGRDLKVPSQPRRQPVKILLIAASVTGLISCLGIMHFQMLAFIDMQLNASFRQRMSVLAPAIDYITEESLRARWALMESKADYTKINLEMNSLAQVAGISLPKPLK